MASMKNDDFRRLVSSGPARPNDASLPSKAPVLGAKRSSFVPMTPRPGTAASGGDFARQVREQHASLKPAKKFKSSAPKGVKFAAGYTDRAKARQVAEKEEAEDDKAKRIKALEEQVKLGQLEQDTFEALRDEILGGDISNTHLVKGLDRRLLERVRRGEDVFGGGAGKSEEPAGDVDEELDKLEEKRVEAVKREKTEKKGVMAPPPVAGVKRTRDEIMAELKAQRKAAAEAKAAAAPSFDSRWRKVGEQAKPKIEIDHKGREVLITVDEDGKVKKRVRKAAPLEMPDSAKPVLGADVGVPEPAPPAEEDDDEDIFADAGTDYNPLGNAEEDDDDSDEDKDDDAERPAKAAQDKPSTSVPVTAESSVTAETMKAPRNYFKDDINASEETEHDRFKGIESVVKKAARLGGAVATGDDGGEDENKEERDARLARRAKMLQQDRDLEDMDMGFGSSRFEDEDDGGDGKKVRLSQWRGNGDDEGWEEDEKGGKKERKRKAKKRKGDVNSAADIMRVIEGRKAGGSK